MDEIVVIRDLVETFNDDELIILAGASSLDNEIKKVTVLDALDAPNYLSGGELVLTSSFIFNNDTLKLITFCKSLKSRGACGLCLKQNRYMDNIPDELIEFGHKNNFFIAQISSKFVWTDIIHRFYSLKYGLENLKDSLSSSLNIVDTYIRLYNADFNKFIDNSSRSFNVNYIIFNENFESIDKVLSKNLEKEDIDELIENVIIQSKGKYLYKYDTIHKFKDYNFLIHRPALKDRKCWLVFSKVRRGLIILSRILTLANNTSLHSEDFFYKDDLNYILYKVVYDEVKPHELNEYYLESYKSKESHEYFTGFILKGERLQEYIDDIRLIFETKVDSKIVLRWNYLYETERLLYGLLTVNNVSHKKISNPGLLVKKLFNTLMVEQILKADVKLYVGNTYNKFFQIINSIDEARKTVDLSSMLTDFTNLFYNGELSFLKHGIESERNEFFNHLALLNIESEKLGYDCSNTLLVC